MGCAQVTSLNLQKHQFGKIPTKIIWIQVAGLTNEHMALLKYSYPSRSKTTAFEESLCVGTMWNYDLYNMRPNAYAGFLSQMTGKKNIKNQCSDYEQKPIWNYVGEKNYKVGIFEGESKPSQRLEKALQCKKHKDYLDGTIFWSMNTNKKHKKYFHINTKKNYKVGEIYHDKSCSTGECFTALSRNVEGTFESFRKNTKNYIYIVRNFNYANELRKKNISGAKIELNEINSVLRYFQELSKKSEDMLVLLTSSNSIDLNFPKSGRQWEAYEKKGKYLKINNTKLTSTVFATGARAENFCGVFDQNHILSRIFSGAKQQGLEFSIINPFE